MPHSPPSAASHLPAGTLRTHVTPRFRRHVAPLAAQLAACTLARDSGVPGTRILTNLKLKSSRATHPEHASSLPREALGQGRQAHRANTVRLGPRSLPAGNVQALRQRSRRDRQVPSHAGMVCAQCSGAPPAWPNNTFNPRPSTASLVRPGSASRTIVAARPYKARLRGRG